MTYDGIHYEEGPDGYWHVVKYPVEAPPGGYDLPDKTLKDFNELIQVIERKYGKEFLTVQAYYNKLFPHIKNSTQVEPAHVAVPFTRTRQETSDAGNGLSANYLKSITELIVARLGVKSFEYKLIMESPNMLYVLYKDEVERVFRAWVRKVNLRRLSMLIFHDAAILGFSHLFIDPWTHELRKVADWELGVYDTELAVGKIKRGVIRDYDFPVSQLRPYLEGFDKERVEYIMDKSSVDLKLYFDCYARKRYAIIDEVVGPPVEYDFQYLVIETYSWDIGVKLSQVSSLFDLLYPMQRAIDLFLGKQTQLVMNYKGPVPVFNKDVDVAIREIGNGAGEAMFLTSPAIDPATIVTTIQPTPLDAEIDSNIEAWKTKMFELAGVQQVSLDIEQYRSAASMIALEQMRDAAFQPQLQGIAEFLQRVVIMYIRYMARMNLHPIGSAMVSWTDMAKLIDEAQIDVKPVHMMGMDGKLSDPVPQVDYLLLVTDRFLIQVTKGIKQFKDIDFSINYDMLKALAAVRYMQIKWLMDESDEAVEQQGNLLRFLLEGFCEDVRMGQVDIAGGGGAEAGG